MNTVMPQARAARWRPVAVPLPASADPDLLAQFDARVARTFALLDAAHAVPDRAAIDAVCHAVHLFAGTAAFFGQAALGTTAGDWNERLRVSGRDTTPADLDAARIALRAALTGDR